MITVEDAMMAIWNKPLEAVERTGDETFAASVDVAARSVERGETELRTALTIAFAAGTYFASSVGALRWNGPITDEMVERGAQQIASQGPELGDNLPPDFAPMLAAVQREMSREILTAALRPVADPPTDDGAGGS